MSKTALKDEEIVKKAFGLLEKEMNLVEYTRFLQLVFPWQNGFLMLKEQPYTVGE